MVFHLATMPVGPVVATFLLEGMELLVELAEGVFAAELQLPFLLHPAFAPPVFLFGELPFDLETPFFQLKPAFHHAALELVGLLVEVFAFLFTAPLRLRFPFLEFAGDFLLAFGPMGLPFGPLIGHLLQLVLPFLVVSRVLRCQLLRTAKRQQGQARKGKQDVHPNVHLVLPVAFARGLDFRQT